jgi:nucleotide-binding universal stress UspA family protein
MHDYSSALSDFRRARRRAATRELLARLGGRPQGLLSFEEVRKAIGTTGQSSRGLQEIPIEAIAGSVGRYEDFTRDFLPRQSIAAGRWASIRSAIERRGMPPIEVYKLGDVYFVQDGHHRVSVARQVGAKTVEAYVTEIPTKAPLSPDDDADDLILKAEMAAFMDEAEWKQVDREVDITITEPGRYRDLREHIAVHRYYMSQEQDREIPLKDAVEHWIDEVYMPVVNAIRRWGLLRDFPERTETDLYLWLMKHRSALTAQLGWELNPEESAADLLYRVSRRPARVLRRMWEAFVELITPDTLESGPATGEWRRQRERSERLFSRVLVALSGGPGSWEALEQAISLAQRENGEVRGLRVLPKGADGDSEEVAALRQEFHRRLGDAAVPGQVVLEWGEVVQSVERRARWSDIVVLHLQYPPGAKPSERLRSGMRALIQRSPRPVLLVPRATPMRHALLAFDGSPKATEALYLAAYCAQRWGTEITVLTTKEQGTRPSIQERARQYLERHGVQAHYVQRSGPPGPTVVAVAAERGCDFVLMGGYGQAPLVEVVLGSTVDYVLREYGGPVLVCR